ncbi:hypothetical protein WJX81_004935 [Elliptochloris bilobata]|uniref:Uncharacterized protein n=1 Tax=Elliptochloris bilobata TaxID=381761 RepID=A0AAW1S9K6_9CHLO
MANAQQEPLLLVSYGMPMSGEQRRLCPVLPRPEARRVHGRVYLLFMSAVFLGLAAYLLTQSRQLLRTAEEASQSLWRPGSDIFGNMVLAIGLLVLWLGLLGLHAAVADHPVSTGMFVGAVLISVHVEAMLGACYYHYKSLIWAAAPFDLTGGLPKVLEFVDGQTKGTALVSGGIALLQAFSIAAGLLHGHFQTRALRQQNWQCHVAA